MTAVRWWAPDSNEKWRVRRADCCRPSLLAFPSPSPSCSPLLLFRFFPPVPSPPLHLSLFTVLRIIHLLQQRYSSAILSFCGAQDTRKGETQKERSPHSHIHTCKTKPEKSKEPYRAFESVLGFVRSFLFFPLPPSFFFFSSFSPWHCGVG